MDPEHGHEAAADQPAKPEMAPTLDTASITLPHRPKKEVCGESDQQQATLQQENDRGDEEGDDVDAEEDQGDGEPAAEPEDEGVTIVKKKKPKKKSKSKEGKKKPTGFEEYYVDAPLTPAEHAEEKMIYDPSKPAIQRLETAIQRYQAKRRMDSERRHIFTKYMAFGGVDVGPKMFEGNDQRDLEAMDAEDILTATATSNIPQDRENWTIDFETVAKGYLSSVFPQIFAIDTEKLVQLGTLTIKNFLNYILHHDVCPEYRANIMAARKIAECATEEIWKAQQANTYAPGDFNTACSTLFGGSFFDAYTEEREWVENADHTPFMTLTVARKVVKFAIAGAGTLEQAQRFHDLACANKLQAKLVHEDGFEVTAITLPNAEVTDFYKEHAKDLKPIGKVQAIAWRDSSLPEEDVPPGQTPAYQSDMKFEFFVEESLLAFFFLGMKVDARVWKLDCGIHYFDKFLNVYCSFYTSLPNEGMLAWKKPRDLRSDHLVWTEGKGNGEIKDEDDADAEA
ncbi:argonaute-binding protein [Arthroderma uncinatum]|uniref:argonaute-binding protein n=1 Tax=Arthroderma uncinatum TaxID=74035 RepID=UPI00144AC251|nr:argonaute-binding protein [Arthroderma uncinatum]KAF3483132.1 argonaute-binding protein [Arthroderma uncinatum]